MQGHQRVWYRGTHREKGYRGINREKGGTGAPTERRVTGGTNREKGYRGHQKRGTYILHRSRTYCTVERCYRQNQRRRVSQGHYHAQNTYATVHYKKL